MADYAGGHRNVSDRDLIAYSKTDAVPTHRIYDAVTTFEADEPGFIQGPVRYLQRVWDAGTVGWCYYDKTSIDPAPLASETTPNYTGSISAHSVLQVH